MYKYYLYTHSHYPMRVKIGEHDMPKGVQEWNGKTWVDDKETYMVDLKRDGNEVTEKEVMDQIAKDGYSTA